MIKKIAAFVSASLIGMAFAGCSAILPQNDLYKQNPNWTLCENNIFQCGSVKVPVNWDKPNGETISIALVRKFTNKAGSLLINPGGPGGSGYDFLVNNYSDLGTKALRDAYTLVSFDPRGVGRSAGIKCLDGADTDHYLYDSNGQVPGSAADIKANRAMIGKFDKACKQNSGAVLGHVDTVSAAKDMDVIRSALGESKLNYLGYSYGTFLGTTYAALFPDKVGRFVLDGAIDPRVSDEASNLNQLIGFDRALNNYLKDCLRDTSSCPFNGSLAEAKVSVSKFLNQMETKTLKTSDGRKLTGASALTGMIMALYSNDYWPYLTQAFHDAFKGDGSMFIKLADFYNDRDATGGYSSNSLEANIAINCLDKRSDPSPQAMAAQNAKMLAASPIMGRYWQNGALICEQWPFPVAKHPADYSAKGAPTIMVVGTTNDPATPFQEAVALAHEVLAKGFLVTFKGEGHTAYGRSNECVSGVVDDFLIQGNLPSKEPVC